MQDNNSADDKKRILKKYHSKSIQIPTGNSENCQVHNSVSIQLNMMISCLF